MSLSHNDFVTVQVSQPLQVRSCSASMQSSALGSFRLFTGNLCPPDFQIALLPNDPESLQAAKVRVLQKASMVKQDPAHLFSGLLQIRDHEVDLAAWGSTLEKFGWLER